MNNKTILLLQELRDLAGDINPNEIINHISITRMEWTFDTQWLDAWHAEFDRIVQAIAVTLESERKSGEAMSWLERRLEIHRLKKAERRKYRQMIQVGCFATNVGDIDMFRKSLELAREVNEIRKQIAELRNNA